MVHSNAPASAGTRRPTARTLLLATALLLALPVRAASPSAVTISPQAPNATVQGQSYAASAVTNPSLCPTAALDPQNTVCDHFQVTVNVPPTFWNTQVGGTQVTITWPSADNDFDLLIYDAAGNMVASSQASGTTSERVLIPAASGVYNVVVEPYFVRGSAYQGTVQLVAQPIGSVAAGGPAEYHGTPVTGTNPDTAPANAALPLLPRDALVLKAYDVGHDAAEPSIGADRKGAVFFAASAFDGLGGSAKTTVLRSTDEGLTWKKVSPAVADNETHPASLDPYLYVDPLGRVFDIDLLLAGSDLSFSDDQGTTWATTALTIPGANDHQTLAAGKRPIGNALLNPLDPAFAKIVYYCVNQIADSWCARSLDGGRSFAQTAAPAFLGVDPTTGASCGGLHGHVVADPDGRIALPKDHCGFPWVATSPDGGDTWTRVQVSTGIGVSGADPAIATDTAGNLYYVWWDDKHHLPYLAISRNHGATWSTPLMIAPPGVFEVNFPTITAGDPGKIAITFPGTTVNNRNDSTRPWNSYMVVSTNALDATPLFLSNIANDATDPVHRGDCNGRCAGMFDFLSIQVSPADGTPWASAVDTCTGTCVTNANAPPNASRGFAIQAPNVHILSVAKSK